MYSNPQYFLNSGCILGRRKEMKNLISYSYSLASVIRDDQQIMIRYALMFPTVASIDIFHDFSMTTFSQQQMSFQMTINFELYFSPSFFYEYLLSNSTSSFSSSARKRERRKEYVNLGLIHSNNRYSNGLYDHFNSIMKYYFQTFYNSSFPSRSFSSGSSTLSFQLSKTEKMRRTAMLLKAVWLINDKKYQQALRLLDTTATENDRKVVDYSSNTAVESHDIVSILCHIIHNGMHFP
jgi:hypothetical protein